MTTRPPFDFDIRVSTDKKRKTRGRRGMSGAVEGTDKPCASPDCKELGQYRAPKSPDHLDDFVWFCKDHVREYNLKWNFFNGTTEEDFQKMVDSSRVWDRPTEPFSRRPDEGRAWARLGINDPLEILGEKGTRSAPIETQITRRLPPTERKAIEILDAKDTMTRAELRKLYKGLVKELHPDLNGGNRSDEERLQEVVWAWDQIKDSRSFKD